MRFHAGIPVLRVADVAQAARWYTDILGFTATLQPPDAPHTSAQLQRDQVELMLRLKTEAPAPASTSQSIKFRPHRDWDIGIRLTGDALVTLLDEARRRTPLVRGPEIMPDGLVEFELEDPDGYRVCVSERLSDTKGIPRAV